MSEPMTEGRLFDLENESVEAWDDSWVKEVTTEIRRLQKQIAALTELVRKVEWGSDYYGETCPWCAGLKESMGFEPPPGHASDCPAAPYLTS